MAIVLFKLRRSENHNAFYSASEANRQMSRDRTLDLLFFFRYKHIIILKTIFHFFFSCSDDCLVAKTR